MRFPPLALAGALAIAASEVGACAVPDELPRQLIESCLAGLVAFSDAENHSDVHNFDLDKRCPLLAERLASSTQEAAIGCVEIGATSIEGLRDLRSFAVGFDRRPVSGTDFSPDFDGLAVLLADVLIEESIDNNPWEQFLRWIEQYAKDGEFVQLQRLLKWLEGLDPPSWLADLLLNGSLVLIVLLALMVIGNELRLAGVVHRLRRPRKRRSPAGPREAGPKQRAMSPDELRALPPRQLAAAILEMVTGSFAERGWLSSSATLTNGELVRQVGERQRGLAGPFSGLVNAIETIIYGDRLPDDEARQRLLASAHDLVERARPPSSGGSG
jgi:hypothetical protein